MMAPYGYGEDFEFIHPVKREVYYSEVWDHLLTVVKTKELYFVNNDGNLLIMNAWEGEQWLDDRRVYIGEL